MQSSYLEHLMVRKAGLPPLFLLEQKLMTVNATLAELVAIDSVSARSNTEIVEYLANACEALGLQVSSYPYTDDNGVAKTNLIALAGPNMSGKTAVQLSI